VNASAGRALNWRAPDSNSSLLERIIIPLNNLSGPHYLELIVERTGTVETNPKISGFIITAQ